MYVDDIIIALITPDYTSHGLRCHYSGEMSPVDYEIRVARISEGHCGDILTPNLTNGSHPVL